MISPTDLLTAIVTKARDIPDLVTALEGDAENIYSYPDSFPQYANLRDAIQTQKRPSVMVAWQNTTPGNWANHEVWKHRFTLYIAAAKDADPFAIFRLLVKGVVTTDALALNLTQIHASVYPMDTPTFSRQFLVVDAAGTTMDYYEMALTLTEIGDV